MQNKVAYIIPGFDESHKRQKGYNKIGEFFKEKGITPIQIDIDWHAKKSHRFEYYIFEFLKKYKKPKNTKVYILGFSFGAVIAFLSSSKTRPTAIILCSLSPYFKEDIPKLPKAWQKWWRKHFQGNDFYFKELAPKIKTKVFLVAGDKEGRAVDRKMRAAKKLIKNSSLYIAKRAKHWIGQKQYLDRVSEVIGKL